MAFSGAPGLSSQRNSKEGFPVFNGRKRRDAAIDAIREQVTAADLRTRAVLTEAIAQMEQRLATDLEQRERFQSSTASVVARLQESVTDSTDEVVRTIEQFTHLCAVVSERLDADAVERRVLTEAISRLARPLAAPAEAASRVLGGTVFSAPEPSGEISIVDDDVIDVATEERHESEPLEVAAVPARTSVEAQANGGSNAQSEPLGGRTVQVLDEDDGAAALTIRANVAVFTGECGDVQEALRLSRELLPDQERILGADHPYTLTTRANIAVFAGECGDLREALRLSRELLPDQERILGADHPDTLTTRNDIAAFTGECGDVREALRLCRELLPDQERILGADHPDTVTTRNDIRRLEEALSTV